MVVSFSKPWFEVIADVSTLPVFQNCVVQVVDPSAVRYPGETYPVDPNDPQPGEDVNDVVSNGYDYLTDTVKTPVVDGVVYEGRARYIPVRAGIYHGGESQVNSMITRSMRFQFPKDALGRVSKGWVVRFVSARGNPSLVGRWGTVSDDFQGGSSAARTVNVFMDSDAV